MFGELLKRLTAPAPAPLPDTDARLALAALLVRIAKSDGHYDERELARIDKILAERHGLNAVEAAKLRASAERLEAEAPDTVRFTRAIKDAVPYEDREGVIEALWSAYFSIDYKDVAAFSILAIVLIFFPSGLLGRPEVEKV